jgi:hypothetical protein
MIPLIYIAVFIEGIDFGLLYAIICVLFLQRRGK